MPILEAIILGLVQGFTEFIPVSSSGHLLIVHHFFGSGQGSLGFDIALHFGTLMALLVFFRKDLWELAINIFAKNSSGRMARLLIVATIPAGLVGMLFGDLLEGNVRSAKIVATSLAVIGVLMIIVDKLAKGQFQKISWRQGIVIGFAQVLALIPGVSRSGITMSAGLAQGLSRQLSARFSFLLAIPVLLGSTAAILMKGGEFLDSGWGAMLAGILTAFLSGIIAIKWMLQVIRKVGLTPFGIYRIVLAILLFAFLLYSK